MLQSMLFGMKRKTKKKRSHTPKKSKILTRHRALAVHKGQQNLLKEALQDLEKELKALQNAKGRLDNQSERVSGDISMTQAQEIELRTKISNFMKKEALLVKKKTLLKDRIIALDKKIEKVSSIERELKEV